MSAYPSPQLIPDQSEAPRLVTRLPGPKASAVIDRDRAVVSPSYTRSYPFVMERAIGLVAEDPDGNVFLDLNAGIAVCSTGHRHPHVLAAVRAQLDRFVHMSGTDFYYELEVAVAERLAALVPWSSASRVHFTNSGAESIEAAFKLARYRTGRQYVIACQGGFHGRTMGAVSLTASKVVQRQGFGPLVPGVTHIPYPHCYRCDEHDPATGHDRCCERSLRDLEEIVFRKLVPPDEVAAVFVEAVQGEGGYIVPPPSFLRGLRRVCDTHGILLVCDEVQTGMGRTGKMFAVEHFGVEPDMISLAKGIASGLPLGALVTRADLMTWGPGAHASTFGGNPVACAAALATLELLEGGLVQHAAEVGDYLQDRLRALMDRHPSIGDVRGLGLMVGVELVRDRGTRAPDPARRDRIVREAFNRGLLLLGCGESTIRFSPPLVISRAQIDTAVTLFDEAVGAGV